MGGLDVATLRHVEQAVLVYGVVRTKSRYVGSASHCCGLQRIHGLGYSSPAHRVDAKRSVDFKNVRVEMACLSGFIVRSGCGVDRRSLGFFTSRFLVEFHGGIDFVCRLAIFPVPSCAHQRAIFNECVHGTH